mmetsp:Transcript_35119/g.88742  ORF Transcript_35119/g.88742 Transcript_35119/m.88742 type:complete len:90 (-) Transcript_35119:115-384(-)
MASSKIVTDIQAHYQKLKNVKNIARYFYKVYNVLDPEETMKLQINSVMFTFLNNNTDNTIIAGIRTSMVFQKEEDKNYDKMIKLCVQLE